MLGVILGLTVAAAFASNSVIARRGVLRASASYIANMSVVCGVAFALVVSTITGDILKLGEFTWQAYLFFALAGIVNFILGRTFGYQAIRLVGSTRANIVSGQYTIIAVLLAIVILKEKLTLAVALGVLFALAGPALMAWKEQAIKGVQPKVHSQGKEVDRRTLLIGLLYAGGAALFWGSSSIFVKLGLDNGGSAIAGNFTAYAVATLAITPTLLNKRIRNELFGSDAQSLRLAVAASLASSVAQMVRYIALDFTSVTVISLLGTTQPVWIMIFAFMFNRKHESFSRWVFVGNTLVMTGAILVII